MCSLLLFVFVIDGGVGLLIVLFVFLVVVGMVVGCRRCCRLCV